MKARHLALVGALPIFVSFACLAACEQPNASGKPKDVTTVTVTPPSSTNPPAPVTTPPPMTFPPADAAPPPVRASDGAKEGEMCGGIAGIMCKNGLHCVMVGPTYPDQAGTCRK
ncbi:MAG: hypothetical protein HOO96_42105 [Polyangiaceae bacterium]|nr:hypothetical protein [Polyangiaceae bacterium]